MPSSTQEPLSDSDLALIREAARRHGHRSGPGDAAPAGCGLAFLGMLLLTLTPATGGFIELSRSVVLSLFGVALLLLLAGAAVGLLGRSGTPGAWARGRAEDALGPILAWSESGGSRGAAVEAAVVLLLCGWYADPSGVHPTYDPDSMAGRLGARGAGLVEAVEAALHRAGASGDGTPAPPRPVFTDRGGGEEAGSPGP